MIDRDGIITTFVASKGQKNNDLRHHEERLMKISEIFSSGAPSSNIGVKEMTGEIAEIIES